MSLICQPRAEVVAMLRTLPTVAIVLSDARRHQAMVNDAYRGALRPLGPLRCHQDEVKDLLVRGKRTLCFR
jgi:hypothetical protein